MKVNVVMLMKLTAICAMSNFALLSAQEIPLSDKLSQEIEITPELVSASNETISKDETTTFLAPGNSSENASIEESGADTMPPRLFPSDEEKILPGNDTILKILQNSSSQGVKSSEETKLTNSSSIETFETSSTLPVTSEYSAENVTASVIVDSSIVGTSDVVTPDAVATESVSSEAVSIASSTTETTVETTEEDYENVDEEAGKTDAENIQEDSNQQQEELEEQFAKNGSEKATINIFEDPVTNEPALHSGHFALIFASTLVIFSVIAYVGLVLWRSRLEARYGTRQRLVTEDVFYSDNQNDTRYFGL